jgi:hypothetical protein
MCGISFKCTRQQDGKVENPISPKLPENPLEKHEECTEKQQAKDLVSFNGSTLYDTLH